VVVAACSSGKRGLARAIRARIGIAVSAAFPLFHQMQGDAFFLGTHERRAQRAGVGA